jgi:hypothetical protein
MDGPMAVLTMRAVNLRTFFRSRTLVESVHEIPAAHLEALDLSRSS